MSVAISGSGIERHDRSRISLRCGTALPMIRKPTSAEQMMWGGWTCPHCGCKVDKYGREIA
jgi:hypothetical protein